MINKIYKIIIKRREKVKKLLGVIAAMVLGSSAMAIDFEIGPRVGYQSYDEDIADSGMSYGLQGIMNFNDSMRLKMTVDHYESDGVSNAYTANYAHSWTEYQYRYYQTSDQYWIYTWRQTIPVTHYTYYSVYWDIETSVEITPIMFEFDYTWNFGNFSLSAGPTLGVAITDISYDASFTSDGSDLSNSMVNSLYQNYSVDAEVDPALLYGAVVGGRYTINDNCSLNLDLSYTFGKADYDVTETVSGYETTYSDEIDLKNFGANISFNYKFA